jgi:bis(5'-nucleosyl)-tetraphosphatase (symmetrical)
MAVYAIGDVQGCHDSLIRLLERIGFNRRTDTLWLTGDLVNRGPCSLETLRLVKSLGRAAITVLGNHDLHLLAVAAGCQSAQPGDTLNAILTAPDRAELIDWLRRQPLVRHDARLGWTLVHAGLAPQWTIEDALSLADEVERRLASSNWTTFLANMYGNTPARWDRGLRGDDRLRVIVNYMTRLRFCTPDGRMDFAHKGPPGTQPAPFVPWFEAPRRQNADGRIVFGHWAALGIVSKNNVLAVDSGCVWGGSLTAFRLDKDSAPLSVKCNENRDDVGSDAN